MGNSSYFRFDGDNKTKYYILSIITKEMGKLKTHSLTACIMDNWEKMPNLTRTLNNAMTSQITDAWKLRFMQVMTTVLKCKLGKRGITYYMVEAQPCNNQTVIHTSMNQCGIRSITIALCERYVVFNYQQLDRLSISLFTMGKLIVSLTGCHTVYYKPNSHYSVGRMAMACTANGPYSSKVYLNSLLSDTFRGLWTKEE